MSAHFNADAFLEAIEPPTFTKDGVTYTGMVLGHDEWMKMAPRLRSLKTGKLSYAQVRLLMRDLTFAMFPPSRWWNFWEKGAAYHILRLPYQMQLEALTGFIQSQVQAMGMPDPGTPEQE